MSTKPNLILTHSFPTNSVLLAGFIIYLKDYFNLYFIDLPGFHPDVPPLKHISIENFANYFQEQIKKLDIDNYWVGGVSFGFLVAHIIEDTRCRGFFAIEPYINQDFMQQRSLPHKWQIIFLGAVCKLHAYTLVWHSSLFRRLLENNGNPRERVALLLKTVNPKTFFEIGRWLLKNHEKVRYVKKPCILLINPRDATIKADKIIKEFKKNFDPLLIVENNSEHYPAKITKEYFEKKISTADIHSIQNFIAKYTA